MVRKMAYANRHLLTRRENVRGAQQNLTRLVYTNSRFEGITATLAQTQAVMDGLGVDCVSIDDSKTIVAIKRGWQLITENDQPLTIAMEKEINRVVAARDALVPGEFRTGTGGVDVGSEAVFTPDLVDKQREQDYFSQLMRDSSSATDKAMTLMYHNMRGQLFWDGNKRSATLAANKIMIDNGAGLLNVPLDKWGTWNTLISDFYRSGDMAEIKRWTYEYGIQGVEL